MYINLAPIYFLHIPKTAGTTVRVWLREIVGADEYFEEDYPDRLSSDPRLSARNWRMYLGHLGWGLPELCANVAVVTFLREPTDLYRSMLEYVTTMNFNQMPAHIKLLERAQQMRKVVENTGACDVLKSEFFQGHFSNSMVRNITDGLDYLDRRPRRISETDLDLAKQRLKRMSVVGLVEKMDWSSAIFADAFRLPVRPFTLRLNKTEKRSAVPPGWKDAVAEANAFDVELYEYSRSLFEIKQQGILERYGFSNSADASALEPFLRSAFVSEHRGVAPFATLRVDSSSDVMMTGFHFRFRHNGRWLRWSGPGPVSRIYLPLDPTSARVVRFDVIYAQSETIRTGLKISVNGTRLDVRLRLRREISDAITAYEFAIPKSLMRDRSCFTEIEIEAPETVLMPNFQLGDERTNRSAFALGQIEVT
ncbi:MAG: hypothetical protein WA268_15695 [Xanthobacteraceae bacterium]